MDEDIDGIPIGNRNDGSPQTNAAGFIPSKWETVDPDQIEAQAVTTSKWDTLDAASREQQSSNTATVSEDSFDSFEYSEATRDFDEEKRVRLRDIELKTVQYQDELEAGQRNLKSGWTVQQQAEHYRRKLMKKTLRELQQDSPQLSSGRTSSLKRSPSPLESIKKAKKSKRSPSPVYNRNSRRKSRSPGYSKKSIRDSVSPPSKYGTSRSTKERSRNRTRSRSMSPSRTSKSNYDNTRRYNRLDIRNILTFQ